MHAKESCPPAGGGAPAGSERSTELLRQLAGGDPRALELLLSRHLSGLRSFVRLRAGDLLRAKESHSDLVQSTCREVLEKHEQFEHGDEAAFRHWLFRTAEPKILDRVRYYTAAKRDAAREARPLAAPTDMDESLLGCYASFHTPSRDVVAREQVERVERAMDALSESHREVILLARVVGLPHKRIAALMGRSEGAVRVLLFRALADLAELIAPDGPPAGGA